MAELVAGATQAQKNWILARDGYHCQQYHFNGIRWVRCKNTTHLQVHHIIARYWSTIHLPPTFHVNGPYNLITLCETCHIGSPDSAHPDTYQATLSWRKGNRSAYEEMNRRRRELTGKGIPYWNQKHDWGYNRIVKKLNIAYLKAHPYPSSGVRGVTGRVQPSV